MLKSRLKLEKRRTLEYFRITFTGIHRPKLRRQFYPHRNAYDAILTTFLSSMIKTIKNSVRCPVKSIFAGHRNGKRNDASFGFRLRVLKYGEREDAENEQRRRESMQYYRGTINLWVKFISNPPIVDGNRINPSRRIWRSNENNVRSK